MTEEEYRQMIRKNYYALMRVSHCDRDGNPDPDFVRIVRCKDCRWGEITTNGKGKLAAYCSNSDCPVCDSHWCVEPDWYCPLGERRKEE